MKRGRSEVYSWRVSPALKASLEEAGRRERRPVSRLLEEIVREYMAGRTESGTDLAAQQELHVKAARFAGCIVGSRAHRAEQARVLVRRKLRQVRLAG